MTTPIEHFTLGYMLWVALVFLLFAKKPDDFGDFAGKFFAWLCAPVLLVLFIIVGWFERKKMRWLRRKWLWLSVNQWFTWMLLGMVKKYENVRRVKIG